MARDVRTNQADYNDRNKYYKRIEGTNEFEEKPRGVFWSKDLVAMTTTPIIINGKIKNVRYEVTIVTLDYIVDLQVDDEVEYGGERFRVEKIIADDLNKNKKFMTRPTFETQITLVK
jgi:hypothetical protein